MSEPRPEVPIRSRFKNVLNTKDCPVDEYWKDQQRYGASAREIAIAIGAKDLGFSIVTLDPGKLSCPFHFHHYEEEMFYVFEGRARLRQGDGQGEDEVIELEPGDFVSFPGGTGVGHQFINHGSSPFVYLALSNRLPHDVAEYPDSDKINIRSKRMLLRRAPTVKYFDGEA
jgi:uncharacterized cupin superfamily protein